MRLFTGISIPAEVLRNLSGLLDILRPAAQLRWSPVYNLHITTRFIGEWPEARLPELIQALQPLAARAPIPFSISGLGWMPNPHSPRILFAAVRAGDPLSSLAAETDDILAALGSPKENRTYRPHLTLARINDAATPLHNLRQTIAKLEQTTFGEFTAPEFSLYLSKPGPAGSIYTQLADIRFSKQ